MNSTSNQTVTLFADENLTAETKKILDELLSLRLSNITIERLLRFKKGLTIEQKSLILSITQGIDKKPKKIQKKEKLRKKPILTSKEKVINLKSNDQKLNTVKPKKIETISRLDYISETKHTSITQKIKKTNYSGRTIPLQEKLFQTNEKKKKVERIQINKKLDTIPEKRNSSAKKHPIILNEKSEYNFDPGYNHYKSKQYFAAFLKTNYKAWNKIK